MTSRKCTHNISDEGYCPYCHLSESPTSPAPQESGDRSEFLRKVKAELVKAEGLVDDIEGIDWPLVDATLKCAAEFARKCYSKVAHPIAKMKCEEIGDKLDSLRNTKGANAVYPEA